MHSCSSSLLCICDTNEPLSPAVVNQVGVVAAVWLEVSCTVELHLWAKISQPSMRQYSFVELC